MEERRLRLCRERCRSSKRRDILQEQEGGDRGSLGFAFLRCPGGGDGGKRGAGHQGSLPQQSPSLDLPSTDAWGLPDFKGPG